MAKMQWGTCDVCGREGTVARCRCSKSICGGCADTKAFDEPAKCPLCGEFLSPDGIPLVKCSECGCTNQYIETSRLRAAGIKPSCVRCGARLPMGSAGCAPAILLLLGLAVTFAVVASWG